MASLVVALQQNDGHALARLLSLSLFLYGSRSLGIANKRARGLERGLDKWLGKLVSIHSFTHSLSLFFFPSRK